jgi:glucan phosphoethanolaminetransferase (alkaline phosphatase superfamily)
MVRWLSTAVVLAHLVVNVLHGKAHTELRVGLSSWQQAYVLAVIGLAPLVAMVLVWTRYARTGLWLLTVSMAGSLVFGVYFHYIAISTDHVSHLPPGHARGLFRTTALLLALTELLGVVVGLWGLRAVASKPRFNNTGV